MQNVLTFAIEDKATCVEVLLATRLNKTIESSQLRVRNSGKL